MLLKSLTVVAFLLLATTPPHPDEGQWLPDQVRKMDWDKLKARGMQLSKDEFWHPEKGGVLTAAVHINGCSASFVSKDGLVVTNHHCGFGAIQRLSTVKKNLVKHGYVAQNREKELPAPGVQVRIVRRIEDVTKQVHAALSKVQSPIERYNAEQRTIRKLTKEAEAKHKNTECSISSFFEGRKYMMYYRTLLTDVRLVYAPPRNVGEFGGETDNWEWPRHTGDFCFFRAYCAPDGKPRKFHKDNVPFQPKHILKVSKTGVQEGDLVIIMGYPGRTERYLSSIAVADREAVYYPLMHDMLRNVIDKIGEATNGDEQKTLAYSTTRKSLANVEKMSLGMVKGLARNAVVERKLNEETQFAEWLKQDEARQEKWGNVLAELIELDKKARSTTLKDLVLRTTLARAGRVTPQFVMWFLLTQGGLNMKKNEDGEPIVDNRLKRFIRANAGRDYKELQLPVFAMMLDEMRKLPESQRIKGTEPFLDQQKRDASEILHEMVKNSPLRNKEGRQELIDGAPESFKTSEDPLVKLYVGLVSEWKALQARQQSDRGRRLVVGPRWIEAQQAWRGTSFYPDANSTMRVSIATVKGYTPRDAVRYIPNSTVQGLLDKHNQAPDYKVPKALQQAAKNRAKSSYFNEKIGDVPVCFLSDGDTTGGNSGSPVINGKGELVGLNFDRAFESIPGDYGWNAERSRNISVDVRYILWFLEQVMPAHHLLDEMGVR